MKNLLSLPYAKEILVVVWFFVALGIAGTLEKQDAQLVSNYEQTLGE